MRPRPWGAILAGGQSTRYGAPKALEPVAGVRIVDRVAAALRAVVPDLIVSANEPALFEDLGLPIYPDDRPDAGPLAGIHTVLRRARSAGRPGVVAVACDMPFPSIPLLARLSREAFGDDDAAPHPDLVVPESGGRRGIEPLFAAYRVSCLPAIEAALAAGDRRMIGFHDAVSVRRIPLAVVASLCDPERAFLNVNTPADRERAESMAEREEGAS